MYFNAFISVVLLLKPHYCTDLTVKKYEIHTLTLLPDIYRLMTEAGGSVYPIRKGLLFYDVERHDIGRRRKRN